MREVITMDRDNISQLFDEILNAVHTLEDAKAQRREFEKLPRPERPKACETIDKWLAYKRWQADFEVREKHIRSRVEEAQKRVEDLTRKWFQLGLPGEVWFRHGEVGIGMAFSDWGGSHSYPVIAPWRDEMPSLDHRYYGS